jgi:hypothetical protein
MDLIQSSIVSKGLIPTTEKNEYPIDHHVNKKHVEGILKAHPSFSIALTNEWNRTANEQRYRDANIRLLRLHERLKLGNTGLFMDSPDYVVRSYCEQKAKCIELDVMDFAARKLKSALFDYVVNKVCEAGLKFPLDNLSNFSDDEMFAAIKRVCDAKWWRRQIRKLQAREVEAVARDIRLVHANAGIYCSNYTAGRRKEQRKRNRHLMESIEAVNEDDYCATLAELSDASVSNPENRRNELMVRIRGFEELAHQAEHTGLFFTLTCPSKFHAFLSAGIPNQKYNDSTPRDGQQYLCRTWSLIRAEWDRNEIKPYGFRVVEPHHDGTPHWHLMLFIEPEKKQQAIDIFNEYAMREDRHEPGAKEYRTKIVEIDPAKGSAAGYIAKYISKNIDGYGIDDDLYGREAKESAQRIEAWASTWGLRQFQQIGGPSVTVWRELRRVAEEDLQDSPEDLQKVREAADLADWAAFTMLMGGVQVKRKEQLLRPLYVPQKELNAFGELATALKGLFHSGGDLITRVHDWMLQRAGTFEKRLKSEADRFTLAMSSTHKHMEVSAKLAAPIIRNRAGYLAPGTGATWTCVNNCTEMIKN